MPSLENPRHEQVAILIAKGQSPTDSYASVYGSSKGAATCARRLLKNVLFCSRVVELQKTVAEISLERTALTRTWVLDSMMLVAKRCMQVEPVRDSKGKEIGTFRFDASGATRSLELLGKEIGLFRDRVDHTMQWDGDPSKLTGAQLAKLKQQLELLAFNGDAEAMEKFKREMQAGQQGKVINVVPEIGPAVQ